MTTVFSPTRVSNTTWMVRESAKTTERMDNTNFWVWKKPEYWDTEQWKIFLDNDELATKYENLHGHPVTDDMMLPRNDVIMENKDDGNENTSVMKENVVTNPSEHEHPLDITDQPDELTDEETEDKDSDSGESDSEKNINW